MKTKVPYNAQLIGSKANNTIIYNKSAIYCTQNINGKNEKSYK